MRRTLGVVLVLAGATVTGAIAGACASRPDPEQLADVRLPDREQFIGGGVSAFMGRRCGALDCHGNDARPLRIFSQTGLRAEIVDGSPRDTRATTPFEHLANYRSVIGLEPEALSKVFQRHDDYEALMLLQKPRARDAGGVTHKGGPVLHASDSDPGWVCLISWIDGKVDANSCRAATF